MRFNPVRIMDKIIDRVCDIVGHAAESFWHMPWYLKYLCASTLIVSALPFFLIYVALANINSGIASQFIPGVNWINNSLFVIHIAFAIPAIVVGPFMIDATTRKKYGKAHRDLGTVYVIGCLGGALSVIPLALNNHPGTPAPYGFTTMAVIWFIVTFFAYTSARNMDFIAHRRWILRSYAMTYAFIHVNFTYKYMPFYYEVSINTIKVMQSMISWQANLMFTEVFLLLTSFKGRFIGWSNIGKHLHFFSPEDKFYFSIKKR